MPGNLPYLVVGTGLATALVNVGAFASALERVAESVCCTLTGLGPYVTERTLGCILEPNAFVISVSILSLGLLRLWYIGGSLAGVANLGQHLLKRQFHGLPVCIGCLARVRRTTLKFID